MVAGNRVANNDVSFFTGVEANCYQEEKCYLSKNKNNKKQTNKHSVRANDVINIWKLEKNTHSSSTMLQWLW